MKKLAISYSRYSSAKQQKGASYTRQIEATESYCRNHGLTLVDRLEDLGVSGWTGANLDDTAALGGFLKEAEQGKIPKGTTLIIENLDRLTRDKILDAVGLFSSILKSRIDIVTTMDGKRYSYDSVSRNAMELIVAVSILSRGNEESETKSKRVKDAWVKKRAAINRGEFVKMTQHPNWLEIRNGVYVPKPEAAKTVKTIFELYASGKGGHVIAKELNKSSIKTYSRRGEKFTFSSVERLLKSEAVIGTCDVVDPPKKDYWPRVIDPKLWYKVQALRKQNNHYKGTRNDVQKINFLGGLAFCAKCWPKWEKGKTKMEKPTMVRYSCTGKNGQRYHYLTCRAAKYGEHSLDLAPYESIQESFIDGIRYNGFLESFLTAQTDTKLEDKTPELEGRLIEVNQRIARVNSAIEKTDNPELITRLDELQTIRKALQAEIEAEKVKVNGATDTNAAYYELLKNLDKKIQDNDFRLALRNFLRNMIAQIIIGRDENRKPFYSVHFKNSKDVVTVELGHMAGAEKSYRISLNGVWQIGKAQL